MLSEATSQVSAALGPTRGRDQTYVLSEEGDAQTTVADEGALGSLQVADEELDAGRNRVRAQGLGLFSSKTREVRRN